MWGRPRFWVGVRPTTQQQNSARTNGGFEKLVGNRRPCTSRSGSYALLTSTTIFSLVRLSSTPTLEGTGGHSFDPGFTHICFFVDSLKLTKVSLAMVKTRPPSNPNLRPSDGVLCRRHTRCLWLGMDIRCSLSFGWHPSPQVLLYPLFTILADHHRHRLIPRASYDHHGRPLSHDRSPQPASVLFLHVPWTRVYPPLELRIASYRLPLCLNLAGQVMLTLYIS